MGRWTAAVALEIRYPVAARPERMAVFIVNSYTGFDLMVL
jgi:hypothetical protein